METRAGAFAQQSSFGLQGRLVLECGVDAHGRTQLRNQWFRAPVYVGKAYHADDVLIVNAVNPTAGLFAGDEIQMSVSVEPLARMVLTAPSANRIHRKNTGTAVCSQNFRIAAGGRLEVWPELFIPHSGARYAQLTQIQIEAGGELLFWEALAPGRVASGEIHEFESLRWDTSIRYGSTVIAQERFLVTPGTLKSLRNRFVTPYYATAFIISESAAMASSHWDKIQALQCAGLWVGASPLREAGWAIRLIASESIQLRSALQQIRGEVYAMLGSPAPDLRKL
jgi:urease accessory protein